MSYNVLEVKSLVLVIRVITSSTFDFVRIAMSMVAFYPTNISEEYFLHSFVYVFAKIQFIILDIDINQYRPRLKNYILALKW